MKQISFRYLFLFFTCLVTGTICAQSIKDVRINEIQVRNTNGLRDEYGQLGGWIELHNTGYGKVNIAGCTLKVAGQEYRIPKGDPATVVPTRGYALFYAGGTPNKGTFHSNLILTDTDFIEFYDIDGKLIDRFEFDPNDMADNISYGWLEMSDGKERLMHLPATTPGSSNNTEEKIPNAEIFRQADPTGVVLTITSIAIVAVALVFLFFIFKYMGNFHIRKAKREKDKITAKKNGAIEIVDIKSKRMVTNDELAAIAIALYKYSEELHDMENMILTINRTAKVYSPWSSKIYTVRRGF